MNMQWLPEVQREARREPLLEINRPDHFKYFLALEQDYAQMERQQRGLRQNALQSMILTKQEVRLAHFHAVLDQWLA
jgi:Ring hydroxylating alpha subunit (catalytic domain)